MQNEHYLNYTGLTPEYIKSYIEKNIEVSELTCLLPKDDLSARLMLQDNGFRLIGRRLVEGKVLIVFKWFRGLDKGYEDMRSFFNRRVHDYDLYMKDDNDYYEMVFLSLVKDIPDTNDKIVVLDLGCGTGAELNYIFQKAPNAHVVCMDVSEQMLLKLSEYYRDYSYNIETLRSSYLGVDFGEKRYDYMVACSTLHHILPKAKKGLYMSLRKGLKDNGYLLIADGYVNPEEEQSQRTNYFELIKIGNIDKNEIYHIDLHLTIDHEVDLLKAAGFTCTRIERVGEDDGIISARS